MDHEQFRDWFSRVDELTAAQRKEVAAVLSGLHHKERWLAFGASLTEGETIKEAAERCGIAPSAAHRWRHRFLAAVRQAPDQLAGIVRADEIFVLESRKGVREGARKRAAPSRTSRCRPWPPTTQRA